MSKFKKNFKRKLHTLCSKNEAQEGLNYLKFYDGYVVCSNGHVLVKQSLKLHDFTQEEIEIMEQRIIHKDVFAELFRYDTVFVKCEEGFDTPYFEATKGKVVAKFALKTAKQEGVSIPNFEAIVPFENTELKPILGYGFNLNFLGLINKLTLNDEAYVKFRFYGQSKACIATGLGLTWQEEIFLIHPVTVD